jgi:hypothetical protein
MPTHSPCSIVDFDLLSRAVDVVVKWIHCHVKRRVLMDTEFPSKNMSLFLLAVKSLVSYIHARHGGLVDGPIR